MRAGVAHQELTLIERTVIFCENGIFAPHSRTRKQINCNAFYCFKLQFVNCQRCLSVFGLNPEFCINVIQMLCMRNDVLKCLLMNWIESLICSIYVFFSIPIPYSSVGVLASSSSSFAFISISLSNSNEVLIYLTPEKYGVLQCALWPAAVHRNDFITARKV